MRKLIFVLLSLVVSGFVMAEQRFSSAKPDWQLVLEPKAEGDKVPPLYIDNNSADNTGYWLKYIPNKSENADYAYLLTYMSIDCILRKDNRKTFLYFDENDKLIKWDDNTDSGKNWFSETMDQLCKKETEPDWELVSGSGKDDVTYYVDMNSVSRDGFWLKGILNKWKSQKCGKDKCYIVAYETIDCVSKSMTMGNGYLYNGNDKLINSQKNLNRTTKTVPGSVLYSFIDSTCSKYPPAH